jgi:glycolate oxidase FAD binding subunit
LPSVSSLAEAAAFFAAAHAETRRVRIGEDVTAAGLDRILEHEAGDLTCTVEAGVRLSALQAAVAERGQRLSLDPPGDPTVGALLAENRSGPLRHRYGAPRDLVLGVTLVLADGTIASAGGKVVKNVAGYDLARLVCGSRGRLAFIARASFRLHPRPQAAQTLVVTTRSPEETAAVVRALRRSQLEPSALDVLHPGRVAVLFEGSPRAVEAQLEAARALAGGAEAGPELWEESRRRQAAAGGRVRFSPAELGRVLGELGEAVVRPSAGVAYAAAPQPRDSLVHATEDAALLRLQEAVRRALDPKGVLGA